MKKQFAIFVLILLVSVEIFAQKTIEVSLNNFPVTNAYLSIQKGDSYQIIDSVINAEKPIIFNFKEDSKPGQYTLVFAKSKQEAIANKQSPQISFIYNHENIKIKSDCLSLQDSLQFIKSNENILHFQFLKKESEFQQKLALLDPIVNNFPKEDKFLSRSIKKYNSLQMEREKFIKGFIKQNAGTFVAKMAVQYHSPFLDGNKSEQERIETIKNEFLSHLNFQYPELINTSIYTRKIIQYLSLFGNRNYNRIQQEEEYTKAIDNLMSYISVNKEVNDFLLQYIIQGFEYMKMETVLTYIADNYLDKNCKAENQTQVANRLRAYQNMSIGKIAPDILITDINNDSVQLLKIKNDYKLVIFWTSSCPHCTDMMPLLKEWYINKTIDLEIISLSIDEKNEDWKSFISSGDYRWINCIVDKGWDGEIAKAYNLYATPTMFILDKDNKILAKPIIINEFFEFVNSELPN